jgi:hypothetical protein
LVFARRHPRRSALEESDMGLNKHPCPPRRSDLIKTLVGVFDHRPTDTVGSKKVDVCTLRHCPHHTGNTAPVMEISVSIKSMP